MVKWRDVTHFSVVLRFQETSWEASRTGECSWSCVLHPASKKVPSVFWRSAEQDGFVFDKPESFVRPKRQKQRNISTEHRHRPSACCCLRNAKKIFNFPTKPSKLNRQTRVAFRLGAFEVLTYWRRYKRFHHRRDTVFSFFLPRNRKQIDHFFAPKHARPLTFAKVERYCLRFNYISNRPSVFVKKFGVS